MISELIKNLFQIRVAQNQTDPIQNFNFQNTCISFLLGIFMVNHVQDSLSVLHLLFDALRFRVFYKCRYVYLLERE